MHEVTGSTGPALVLRAIFNELNRNRDAKPLYMNEQLVKHRICIATGQYADGKCEARDEGFVPGTGPEKLPMSDTKIRLHKPSRGLSLAMDPRIPDDHEYFEFSLSKLENVERVRSFVNEKLVATTNISLHHWKLSPGKFTARAEVLQVGRIVPVKTDTVEYQVN
jgi:penicillin-binding protein 1C